MNNFQYIQLPLVPRWLLYRRSTILCFVFLSRLLLILSYNLWLINHYISTYTCSYVATCFSAQRISTSSSLLLTYSCVSFTVAYIWMILTAFVIVLVILICITSLRLSFLPFIHYFSFLFQSNAIIAVLSFYSNFGSVLSLPAFLSFLSLQYFSSLWLLFISIGHTVSYFFILGS